MATRREFALVFAATAWNWVDPAVRYGLAWRALRPGGHLAFWNAAHVFPTAATRSSRLPGEHSPDRRGHSSE